MNAVAKVWLSATIPKEGLSDEESEDQFEIAGDLRSFAVSDGATHSLRARLWARCLVERFCMAPCSEIAPEWLAPAISRFFGSIDVHELPWHAIAKLNGCSSRSAWEFRSDSDRLHGVG